MSRSDRYVLSVDLSSFDQSEVKLHLTSDRVLHITAEHEEEKRSEDEEKKRGVKHKSIHIKRSLGSVERRLKVEMDS